MKLVDDSIYDMTTVELIRLLRAYIEHKRTVRSAETWKPDHFLDLVEEAVNRLECNWKRDMSV